MKYSFKNDYAEGAHPEILQTLMESNLIQQPGYGDDAYSRQAAELLRKKCNSPGSAVYFVSGGTQANLVAISAFLRPHESVISAETGHIYTNETGAIEATGHKVHPVSTDDGKITPADIQRILDAHRNVPHQLKPKLVYISNATELGTVYSKTELKALCTYCREHNLLLYADGARLGNAMAASEVTLQDMAALTDAFYLGATKNGGLLGEAIIINHPDLQPDFGFHLKQKGALLAKGRLLGIQFLKLFDGNLYVELAAKANRQAMKLKNAFAAHGISFLTETETNQIFPILQRQHIAQLAENFDFYIWQEIDDDYAAIRLITSWATPDDEIENFMKQIHQLK